MSLKNILANLSKYALGFAGFAAIILVWVALFFGFAAVVKFLYPLFSTLASISICIFLVIILPLSLFNRLRPAMAVVSYLLSITCGVSIWMYSFLVIIGYLGWFALLLFLLFHFVAPIATIGLFFKGQWLKGLFIVVGLGITHGMRFYSVWLEKLCYKKQPREADIIDIEAENINE